MTSIAFHRRFPLARVGDPRQHHPGVLVLKYFGATGWRLGTVATTKTTVLDKHLAALPADVKARLAKGTPRSPTTPSRSRSHSGWWPIRVTWRSTTPLVSQARSRCSWRCSRCSTCWTPRSNTVGRPGPGAPSARRSGRGPRHHARARSAACRLLHRARLPRLRRGTTRPNSAST